MQEQRSNNVRPPVTSHSESSAPEPEDRTPYVRAILEAASRYAARGESLALFLEDLEVAYAALEIAPPGEREIKAAGPAWSDSALGTLESVCEDPLTGLATVHHARTLISDIYREAGAGDRRSPAESHAVVVISLWDTGGGPVVDRFDATFQLSLRMATVAESVRQIFVRHETLASLGRGRMVAVVARDEQLSDQVDELERRLKCRLPSWVARRIWIEQMPVAEKAARKLLDQLAR